MKTEFAPEHLLTHKPQDKMLWDRSWGVLGHSWALLGRSWGAFGRSWGALPSILGALGALLGRSCGEMGAPGCSWGDLGSLWGAFGSIFWSMLGWLGGLFGFNFRGFRSIFFHVWCLGLPSRDFSCYWLAAVFLSSFFFQSIAF